MKRILLILILNSISAILFPQVNAIIPAPVHFNITSGEFVFDNTTYIVANDIIAMKEANAAKHFFIKFYNTPLKIFTKPSTPGKIIFVQYDSSLALPDGGYILDVSEKNITITGKNKGGVFYGLMSLMQLLEIAHDNTQRVKCCKVTDYPRFQYRGMHLDCARHFFDLDFIKQYIDYLALYKYNVFHWHLTDDQGWRIEIKKYPKLTSVGAWRDGSMTGHYKQQKFDSIPYGGYYTQAEIKQIVKYAQDRNITIIPEIEMPGHCLAALAAYPELGCITDTTYKVAKAWGVHPDVFCPTEETFSFLENVLNEVMAIFPSEYIHIGGDEVEKTRWKNSAFCQSMMLEKKLQNEHELQRYFVQRIEQHINSKGKKMIGWDEILEGGLTSNATIMSWRGEEGGIHAAQQGHYAIMTPTSHCYFDYYQSSPAHEPLAIGGYLPLEKVYAYEPIPAQLTSEQSKYILGAQANVWTEYITTPEHVEYMAIPRMLALSEVVWSAKENKEYDDFIKRLLIHFKLLDKLKCNYAKAIYRIDYEILPTGNYTGVIYVLAANTHADKIYVNTTENLLSAEMQTFVYTKPDTIKKDQVVWANQENKPSHLLFQIHFNKATGKKIALTPNPSKTYNADGPFTLVNGIVATTEPNWSANEWLGFEGTDCEVLIDLGNIDTVTKITVGYLEDKLSWIWTPASITVQLSEDGKHYTMPVTYQINTSNVKNKRNFTIGVNHLTARHVKIQIENHGSIPSGYPGAGNKAWLFIDEISIE
jgi:hexosaminidase